MTVAENSDHASMDIAKDLEILNLEKKLLECLAERDRIVREKNELMIEEKNLIKIREELNEEVKVKTKVIISELAKEKEALFEAFLAKEKSNAQLDKEVIGIVNKSEHRSLSQQLDLVRAEFNELSNEKHKLSRARRKKQDVRRQIERSTIQEKPVQCDLISVIVDFTSHIRKTIFPSKYSKLKDT